MVFVVAFGACFQETDFGETFIPFYPPEKILKEGFVNKYYLNTETFENNVKSTNIIYEKFQLKDSTLYRTQYSSGYNVRTKSEFGVNTDGLILKNEMIYFANDSSRTNILKNQELFWDHRMAEKNYSRIFDGYYSQEIHSTKQFIRDTIWENRPAKMYSFISTERRLYEKGDTTNLSEKGHLIIAEGIGPVSFYTKDSLSQSEKLLIEQLSVTDFEKRANHGTHRVAYIDTSSAIVSAKEDFLCKDRDQIYDYYNSDIPAGFPGGKGPLKKFVFKHLDESKLAKESGFLTFRFVINCKGEADWYTLEQADFDYKPMSFSQSTIDHLLSILQKVPTWHASKIRGELGDAYAYITFKLNDGEIFEMLP